ncbi:NUDIX domain-containing protein [Sphingomonas sp. BIUV-7]|uniref:NUDIX domain-containing protein n=1 Tax=Sphingomonas natans TaxID=3063330 RepID=A0ABT8YB39_9SPHN|nr:NUDIX domain-containing protein [Sphingomonas sp. BIUV-7]MDO6414870.1 NUDIX domain-containing protein [Sphingomonas sp. BIUV-7]
MTHPRSAGVLLYRRRPAGVEVLLVLPGGPYWRRRNEGAWQIPKGAIEPGEEAIETAVRELHEELGLLLTDRPRSLCTVRQAGGKRVEAFAAERDWDVADLVSNEITIEWPPRSGKIITAPEVGEARWFALDRAEEMMLASQRPFLSALELMLHSDESDAMPSPVIAGPVPESP